MTLSEIRPDYDGDWRNLEGYNIFETYANSRYYIVKDANVYIGEPKDGQYIDGNILVAATGEGDMGERERPSIGRGKKGSRCSRSASAFACGTSSSAT